MSANVYVTEPMTSGKVVIHTTVGPLDVELWSAQIPKATRNFIQLCLEGYYDKTIFHRVLKDYLVQGGDPTGTGFGGESIYDTPFKDEYHSRLRFTHRGIVACASFERNQNGSQFFITLGPAPELDKKNTIFGKVTGDTIFNLLRMNTLEVDKDDKPLKPPQILKTEVLWNPFDDIIPRKKIYVEQIPHPSDTSDEPVLPKPPPKKNLSLLSFADDTEEYDEESEFKSISSFTQKNLHPKKEEEEEEEDEDEHEKKEKDKEKENAQQVARSTKKLKKRIGNKEDTQTKEQDKENPEETKSTTNQEESSEEQEKIVSMDPERERIKQETQKILDELKKKKKRKKKGSKDEKAGNEAKAMLRSQREKYAKRQKKTEDDVMLAFESFRSKLLSADQSQEESWTNHRLKFEHDESESKVKDPSLAPEDDGLVVYDPLKDYKPAPGERQLNKHQQKLRAKKNLEKW